MSLRARLTVGLVGVAAVGLLVVDAISYAALRSYLLDRVDQQVQSALPLVGRTLVAPKLIARAGDRALRDGPPRRFAPPDGGERPGPQPPFGTFAELLNDRGRIVKQRSFSLSQGEVSKPDLPDPLPLSQSFDSLRLFTASSPGSSSDFRAAAVSVPEHTGTLVVAVSLQDADQTLAHLRLIGLIVTGAVLLAIAALAWWVIKAGLRPLERMGETANAIAAGDLSARVESSDERTEVGRLGLALNKMLGQIERAFAERQASEDRLRRFLADASHELRTPLSSIRGYAELFRTGAAREPGQLDRAMRRIEDEAERMGGLVDDLLALARLDEVREAVREPVDLAGLAREACDDAATAAPDRAISLRARGSTEVLGDRDQLRRVITNLLRNATMHTPKGTPIDVSVTGEDRSTTVAVRDHGPGLEPGTEAQVFERFWRDGESRRRDGSGAGLGLAIVAAITKSHGGAVAAANAAGGGAEFTVTLPAWVGQPAPA